MYNSKSLSNVQSLLFTVWMKCCFFWDFCCCFRQFELERLSSIAHIYWLFLGDYRQGGTESSIFDEFNGMNLADGYAPFQMWMAWMVETTCQRNERRKNERCKQCERLRKREKSQLFMWRTWVKLKMFFTSTKLSLSINFICMTCGVSKMVLSNFNTIEWSLSHQQASKHVSVVFFIDFQKEI